MQLAANFLIFHRKFAALNSLRSMLTCYAFFVCWARFPDLKLWFWAAFNVFIALYGLVLRTYIRPRVQRRLAKHSCHPPPFFVVHSILFSLLYRRESSHEGRRRRRRLSSEWRRQGPSMLLRRDRTHCLRGVSMRVSRQSAMFATAREAEVNSGNGKPKVQISVSRL